MGLYNDVINELQDYIINENFIQNALKDKLVSICKLEKCKEIQTNVKKEDFFISKELDSLFWCFYIMKYGEEKYQMLMHKNTLVVKQLKIDFVSIIRKNKPIIKQYKFDSIINIENNLANENNLNINTFLILCAIENINIIFIRKNSYFELITNPSNLIYLIKEIIIPNKYYKKYGFKEIQQKEMETIKNNLYKINNIEKPIKNISAYKVSDLEEICLKLNIEINNKDNKKRISKKDMYESIIQYF